MQPSRRSRRSASRSQEPATGGCISNKTLSMQTRKASGGVVSPAVSSMSRRRLRSCSSHVPSPLQLGDDASLEQILQQRIQELLELQQQSQQRQDDASLMEVCYVDTQTAVSGHSAKEMLDNCYFFIRICPDGQIESFLMEGWSSIPWSPQQPPSFDTPLYFSSGNTPFSLSLRISLADTAINGKKRKSRAHVLRPGALSLIPYGQDERVLWTKRIFHFIGKMRKVLGDRRIMLPWGGSILDSVIGVYITQNVSDTFSSKAFINITAKYPSPHPKCVCPIKTDIGDL